VIHEGTQALGETQNKLKNITHRSTHLLTTVSISTTSIICFVVVAIILYRVVRKITRKNSTQPPINVNLNTPLENPPAKHTKTECLPMKNLQEGATTQQPITVQLV